MGRDGHQGEHVDRPGEVPDQEVAPEDGAKGGPRRRAAPLLLAAALVAAAAIAAAALLLARDGGDEPVRAVDLEPCRALLADAARECLTRSFRDVVGDRGDPRPAVAAIESAVRTEGGFVLSNCHGVMHTVGRTYALQASLELSDLQDVLPRSNDPGCSAGFAHGLVTGVAPTIDVRRPREAGDVCADAGTRYQRYSCVHGLGHAFMRLHGDRLEPALELCTALGEPAPDCAQGAYHDYWFAVVGADEATLPGGTAARDPRVLCAEQPERFVRPCWYRAFVDNRPEGIVVDSPEYFDVLCRGLAGLQRQACVTAVSVIGPPDPALQLDLCARLPAADAESCVRGTKVQNLLSEPPSALVDLVGRCELFAGAAREACYRWLGKTTAVVTDGAFADAGCPQLDAPGAEAWCRDGAASMDAALVTFS